jgi:hypothetical protein
MNAWDIWKKGFDAWEASTAKYLETVLRSPAVLTPSGAALSAVMRSKAALDRAQAQWWAAWGLPTRHDQERALHALNQIQSRLADLEEQLAALEAAQRPASPQRPAAASRAQADN